MDKIKYISSDNLKRYHNNVINSIKTTYVTKKEIEDNELVTAAALSELNDHIEESELVMSETLNEVDGRINDIESFINLNKHNMIETTYDYLKTLIEDSLLIPGKYYRIIDYVTTTSQIDTQSAGHQFDVVVIALDESTISENAFAMIHEGDTYFTEAGANLSAWQIWYCVDNDTNRFAWADTTNGKGVIYRMIDEHGNDCPYDFKNIQFKRYKITSTHEIFSDDKTKIEDYLGYKSIADLGQENPPSHLTIPSDDDYIWCYTINPISKDTDGTLLFNTFNNKILKCINNSGVLYLNNIVIRFIEGNNLYNQYFDTSCYNITIISSQSNIFSNSFGQYCRNNILISDSIAQNIFGDNMHSNCIITGATFWFNKISNYCQRNTVNINEFLNNTMGIYFTDNNILCQYFNHNKISNYCQRNIVNTIQVNLNTIGNSFVDNTIKGYLDRNKIDDGFQYNNININENDTTIRGIAQCTIGMLAKYNNFTNLLNCDFKQLCLYNTISNITASTFGIGFRYNVFKVDADLNSADRRYITGCTFGNYIFYNNFYNTSEGTSTTPIKCLNVQSYLQGTESAYNHIEVPVNSNAEIKVAKNSAGEIKVYCEADLIA